MALPIGGGRPLVFRATVDEVNGRATSPLHQTNFVQVLNEDAVNALRIYFTEKDFTDDANYIELDPAKNWLTWEGPVELYENERRRIWFKGVGGPVEVVAVFFIRHG